MLDNTTHTPITLNVNRQQTGAALITCLLFLMVMTILGISSITSSTMEEKMAGNTRNRQVSFQAAEAALRVGETWTENINNATTINSNGYYDRSFANNPIWEQPTTVWQNTDAAGTLVARNPEYLIESYGESPRDANCMLELPIPAGCMLPMYRVTAKGYGLHDRNHTLVQSTYKLLGAGL